jgi:photosystem II stability/assembly factor-like uncharacterized protein
LGAVGSTRAVQYRPQEVLTARVEPHLVAITKLSTNTEPRSYLLKTTDGGLTWQRIALKTDATNALLVRSVFIDSQTGWVFGESGCVLITRDGGAHWARQGAPTKYLLLGGAFVDDAHGWLVGAGGTILQTIDGGVSWHNSIVGNTAATRFIATSLIGDCLGCVVGTGGRIVTTTDGGQVGSLRPRMLTLTYWM